jgi:hypothetical protein
VQFSFQLVGVGWARAEVNGDSGDATLTASYLGDALGDLLDAVGTLLDGAESATCHWEEEPGEFRWKFVREGERVHLVVLALPDNLPPQPDESGAEVFRTDDSLTSIANTIADGAQRVLDEWGEAGYLERWVEAPFPTAQLARVRKLLGVR